MDVTGRYKDLGPDLVRLAARASNSEEGHLLVKKACRELNNQLDDIRKKHHGDFIEPQVSLSNFNENVDKINAINNLFEKVKGLKKKVGRKGGRRPRCWVEKQPKKKKTSDKDKLLEQSKKKKIIDKDTLI